MENSPLPLFSILMPVLRPPTMMSYAIESVRRQVLTDWELFVVLDGAPDATRIAAEQYASHDSRIHVRSFAKGERNGEAHRHTVLQEASGCFVTQIADDDLWFPDFLMQMRILLTAVDFGNLPQCEITANGGVYLQAGDLANAVEQERLSAEVWNFFGPTFAGYRRQTYDRITGGWSPAPPDIYSDLYMWRKFLALTEITVGTRFSIQGVKLSAPLRSGISLVDRGAESRGMARSVNTSVGRAKIRLQAMRSVLQPIVTHSRHTDHLTLETRINLARNLIINAQTDAVISDQTPVHTTRLGL